MSPSGKRDAATAFAAPTESTSHRRKRHRKSQGQSAQPAASTKPTIGLMEVEKEKELSRQLSKHHAALEAVKPERQKVVDANPAKKSSKSTPPKPKKEHIDSQTEPTDTPCPASKKPLAASKPSLKDLPQEDRKVEVVKRPQDRNVSLKEKQDKASTSERVEEMLEQVNGQKPATVNEATQLARRRVRGDKKKKAKSDQPVNPGGPKPRKLEVNKNGWAVTTTNGGLFIDHDPLLTKDDQYLILPTHSEIQVYSTRTSLLVRSLRAGAGSHITSCALSTIEDNRLYVSSSQGDVTLWDWTTGTRTAKISAGEGVRQILPVHAQEGEEVILLLLDQGGGSRNLVSCRRKPSQSSFTDQRTILRRSNLQPCVQSYAQASILVAYAEDKILVGQSQPTANEQGAGLIYTWREVTAPAHISSLDAQVHSGKSKTSRKAPYLDVVVGLSDGVIMHFEDLLFKLIGKEKRNQSNTEDITARKLHWHRTAVNAVKWSRDRNYIISGGNENVLVIWQLDSNEKQFLPHLSTPILNLTVSSNGSAYALRLADNSIMILSTADLLPSTNISGLALGKPLQTAATTLFHPRTPNHLLVAIPADAFHSNSSTSLQIYDIDSSLQVTRQALTRSMITASNVAPTGHPIREPTVTHMDISYDGKWLATIDKWTPHQRDLEAMHISSDAQKLTGKSTETSLRVWLWNEENGHFEQVTRIDEPHKPGKHSVLGMAFNPIRLELATIGADAAVRLWSPKSRHRNGVSVRNSANEQLYTWTSSRTIHCEHEADQDATHAALAYAEDGSVIATSWSFPSTTPVMHAASASSSPKPRFTHLIDPSTGNVVFSQPSLLSFGQAKLVFHSRYLICLSSSLHIFDTIACRSLASPIPFDPLYVPPQSEAPIFLARNRLDGTFAVGVGKSEWPRQSRVSVFKFEKEHDKPGEGGVEGSAGGAGVKVEYQGSFTGVLKGLLALTTSTGYFLVDERNQTRVLRQTGPSTGTGALALLRGRGKKKPEVERVTRGLDSIFGRASASASALQAPAVRGLLTSSAVEDGDNGVEGVGGLESVLRCATSAMAPTPSELFARVVGVLGQVK